MRHSRFQYVTKVTARIKGVSRDFTLDEIFAVTVLWKKTNGRRAGLIHKKFRGDIDTDETYELVILQGLADYRSHLVSLLPSAHTSIRPKWSKCTTEVVIQMEYVDDKVFTLQEIIDIVFLWNKKNKWRLALIDKMPAHEESSGEPLTAKENEELKYLQELSGYWRHLYHPLLWPTLEELERLLDTSEKQPSHQP